MTHALVGDASVLYRRERNSLSDLVVDGECSFDISGLNLGRFAGVTDFDPDADED